MGVGVAVLALRYCLRGPSRIQVTLLWQSFGFSATSRRVRGVRLHSRQTTLIPEHGAFTLTG